MIKFRKKRRYTNTNIFVIRHEEVQGFFPTANDRGEGFLEGSCSGGVLTIILRATKAVELKNVQWAADTWANWQRQHGGMNSCQPNDGICDLSADGKTMTIRVPGSDTMAFAVNVIFGYILPTDWTTNPELATCVGMYLGIIRKMGLGVINLF